MPTATEASKNASARKTTGSTQKGAAKSTNRREMTDEHKASLQEGREQARLIGRYLEALDTFRPKRGRKVTKESRERQLAEIEDKLTDASPLARVNLIAERDRLREFLDANGGPDVDFPALEADFVRHAKAYSARKEIPRSAWREAGVDPKVLDAAGIKR